MSGKVIRRRIDDCRPQEKEEVVNLCNGNKEINWTQIGKDIVFIVNSSLGSTDCSGCEISKKGTVLFAKRIEQPGFVTLPIKIAEMPSVAAAEIALKRIQYAIKTGKRSVELMDLEETDLLC